ncbi:hypothetical protein JHK82_040413 [Glycine max]|uniref:Uncharacterized protein n=2 Tax=Glycine subgen. Soja TaxID=1462606 RepID=K7M7R5_SOYBN|nr:hypothetical protein JHK87_040422 [Glycine soja]KAG4963737.1 hypothetical protein JHK86_040605 [Glycine max]KAG4966219.1 hypothetical protein JHK85_041194 [Glycine max]KAG5111190.1 hypothetical protein JHK82_040413 [Glycine max]KAG5122480.1 hypothetical protein JHK84_040820 [Glycine max]
MFDQKYPKIIKDFESTLSLSSTQKRKEGKPMLVSCSSLKQWHAFFCTVEKSMDFNKTLL